MKMLITLALAAVLLSVPARAELLREVATAYRLRHDSVDETYTQLLHSVQLESLLRECGVRKPDLIVAEVWASKGRRGGNDAIVALGNSKCRREVSHDIENILDRRYRYEPVIATVLAGLETVHYRAKGWVRKEIATSNDFPVGSEYYRKPVVFYAKRNVGKKRPLFVLLNGSFSVHPLWNSKLETVLDEEFDSPHMISISGFLSPEFLAFEAKTPPVSSFHIARDLYERIRAYLKQSEAGREDIEGIGLIGASGGGRLVVELLAIDVQESRRRGEPLLFARGGVALSPPLDLQTVFSTLDTEADRNRTAGFPDTSTLSQEIRQIALKKIKRFRVPGLEDFLPMAEESVSPETIQEMRRRFYNEFIHVYLKEVANGFPSQDYDWFSRGHEKRRCDPFFREYAFEKNRSLSGESTFEAFTDLRSKLKSLRSPLFVVFSKDDPVVGGVDYSLTRKLPRRLTEIFDLMLELPQSKYITLFLPEHGAHHAYFLDTRFLRTLFTRFFTKAKAH